VLNQVEDVDRLLHALGDPTRRRMVERLGRGPATVTELAEPLPMSLPGVLQHLHVLTNSGLVATEKVGRVRTCRLEPGRLDVVQDWIAARRQTWERRLDRLGDVLAAEAGPRPRRTNTRRTDTRRTDTSRTDTSRTEEGRV
jgi:DNA-binding transcriptional ArsR family regulator